MTTFAKPYSGPVVQTIHLPRWDFLRPLDMRQRRRRATMDLIHSSPHLLRDIGVEDGRIVVRAQ